MSILMENAAGALSLPWEGRTSSTAYVGFPVLGVLCIVIAGFLARSRSFRRRDNSSLHEHGTSKAPFYGALSSFHPFRQRPTAARSFTWFIAYLGVAGTVLVVLVLSTAAKTRTGTACTATPEWPGWAGIKFAFLFGDSYTQTGFNYTQTPPSASNPIGNPPYPGWTSSNGPNWAGFLTTKYNASSLLTYNLAYGGATVDGDVVAAYASTVLSVRNQILDEFIPGYTRRGPAGAPLAPGAPDWHGHDSLFTVWVGINDIGNSFERGTDETTGLNTRIFHVYADLVDTLYTVGARNFVFLTVPPVDRSPLTASKGSASQALEKEDIAAFNALLKTTLARSLQSKHSADVNVWVVDTMLTFNAVLDSPSSFPQTSGLKDTTGWCEAYAYGTPAYDTLLPECRIAVNEYFWLNSLHPTYPIHEVVAEQVARSLLAGPNVCR